VSAYFEDSRAIGVNGDQADNSMEQSGAVYVFARTGAVWSQQAYLKASNTGEAEEGDQFGFSLALSDDGNTLAAGAISEDSADAGVNGNQADNSASSAGAVYVFVRAGPRWSQQAYIKSSSPNGADANDLFGYSVGLSADGNTLAVGSYDEAGSSNVINGLDIRPGWSDTLEMTSSHHSKPGLALERRKPMRRCPDGRFSDRPESTAD
jgi:hypothetical protein